MMLRLAPAILFFLVIALLALSLWQNPAEKTLPSTLLGKNFPVLNVPYLDSEETRISEKGMRLVNIFASWCVPCIAELPYLAQLKNRYPLTLIGIAWKDKPDAVKRWLTTHDNPYDAVLLDTQGATTVSLGLTGVPETYLIDAEGILRYRLAGPLTAEIIKNEIDPLLNMMTSHRVDSPAL